MDKAQYCLFAGEVYYPLGGIDDLVAVIEAWTDAEASELAQQRVLRDRSQWAHLVRVEEGAAETVCEWSCSGYGEERVLKTSIPDTTSEQGATAK